jgi:hypothetical protein
MSTLRQEQSSSTEKDGGYKEYESSLIITLLVCIDFRVLIILHNV